MNLRERIEEAQDNAEAAETHEDMADAYSHLADLLGNQVRVLTAEVERLRGELTFIEGISVKDIARMSKDGERLDWLEGNHGQADGYCFPVRSLPEGRWWLYHDDDDMDVDAPTLREVVDAARAGEPKS